MKILFVNNRTFTNENDFKMVKAMGFTIHEFHYSHATAYDINSYDQIFIFTQNLKDAEKIYLQSIFGSVLSRIKYIETFDINKYDVSKIDGVIDMLGCEFPLMHLMIRYIGLGNGEKNCVAKALRSDANKSNWIYVLFGQDHTIKLDLTYLETQIKFVPATYVVLICNTEEDIAFIKWKDHPNVKVAPFLTLQCH